MRALLAWWDAFKVGFRVDCERTPGGLPSFWLGVWRLLRQHVGPAIVERVMGVLVFALVLGAGLAVLWVARQVLVLARGLVVPLLLCCLVGCDVDSSALRASGDAGADMLGRPLPHSGEPARFDAGAPLFLPDAGTVPICGSGPIYIAEDCGQVVSGWRCEVAAEESMWRAPCLVPGLSRLIVASCDLCQAVRL